MPASKLSNPEALEPTGKTSKPSHQQEDCTKEQGTAESDDPWIEKTFVGVFHELNGPKIHDPQTEEVRRWSNDNIRAGHEQMSQRMKESSCGLTF